MSTFRYRLGMLLVASSIILSVASGAAFGAEEKYPTKPIRLIVGWGAGGATDLGARVLASVLPEFLGQPVVVINKPGASGTIAFDYVRQEKPDGYTLRMAAAGDSVHFHALNPKSSFTYDQMTAVARTQLENMLVVTSPGSPWKSISDLAIALKNNPGKYKYSTAGVASTQYLGAILVLRELGLSTSVARPIHYDSGNATILAPMQNEVDFCISNLPATISHLQSGKLRCIAQVPKERMEQIPDCPTFTELGYPGMSMEGFLGVAGPPALPDRIVRTLAEAIKKATNTNSWRTKTIKSGDTPGYLPPQAFANYIQTEFMRYRQLYTELDLIVK